MRKMNPTRSKNQARLPHGNRAIKRKKEIRDGTHNLFTSETVPEADGAKITGEEAAGETG